MCPSWSVLFVTEEMLPRGLQKSEIQVAEHSTSPYPGKCPACIAQWELGARNAEHDQVARSMITCRQAAEVAITTYPILSRDAQIGGSSVRGRRTVWEEQKLQVTVERSGHGMASRGTSVGMRSHMSAKRRHGCCFQQQRIGQWHINGMQAAEASKEQEAKAPG